MQGKIGFRVARNGFSFGGWLRRPRGQGGSNLSPMPPVALLYPLQTAEEYLRPLFVPKGVLPPVSRPTGFVSGTHFVWYLSRGTYRRRVSLPWRLLATTPGINRRPGAGGGISCAEGDSGPPRDGSEPSWARPCEASGALLLSNGGSGGGHAACTLWPPPAPFGYFPVMESTSSARRRTKPPTRNRFPVEGKGKGLSYFFRITKGFASAEATKGLSGRPLETFGPPAAHGTCHKK